MIIQKIGKWIIAKLDDGTSVKFPDTMSKEEVVQAISRGDGLPEALQGKLNWNNIRQTVDETGGVTLNPNGSIFNADEGYIVTIGTETVPKDQLSEDVLRAFVNKHKDRITDDVKIGMYKMDDGTVSLDLNLLTDDRGVAMAAGKLNNQEGIFDLSTFETIRTGGTGEIPGGIDAGLANFERANRLKGSLTPEGNLKASHWSKRDDLESLSPESYGTGLSGRTRAEMNRAYHPDFVKRTYVGHDEALSNPYRKEAGLGNVQYGAELDLSEIYDINRDPLDLRSKYPDFTTREKAIKELGFKGYTADHPQLGIMSALFDDVDVKKLAGVGAVGYLGLSEDDTQAGVVNKIGKNIWKHGSPDDFDAFDPRFLGRNTGAKDADKGFYFAGTERTSNTYLDSYLDIDLKRFEEKFGVSLDDAKKELEETRQILLDKGIDPDNISIKDELRLEREARNNMYTPASEEALAYTKYKNMDRNLNPYSLEKLDKRLVKERPLGQTVTAELEGNYMEVDMMGEPWDEAFQNKKAREALEEGYDGIVYRNMQDSGWFGGTGTDDIVQTFDPKNIKIIEIAKKYGIAPGAVTAGMLMQEENVSADTLRIPDPVANWQATQSIAKPAGYTTLTDQTDDLIANMLEGVYPNPRTRQEKAETLNMLLGATGTLGSMQLGSDVGTFIKWIEDTYGTQVAELFQAPTLDLSEE